MHNNQCNHETIIRVLREECTMRLRIFAVSVPAFDEAGSV